MQAKQQQCPCPIQMATIKQSIRTLIQISQMTEWEKGEGYRLMTLLDVEMNKEADSLIEMKQKNISVHFSSHRTIRQLYEENDKLRKDLERNEWVNSTHQEKIRVLELENDRLNNQLQLFLTQSKNLVNQPPVSTINRNNNNERDKIKKEEEKEEKKIVNPTKKDASFISIERPNLKNDGAIQETSSSNFDIDTIEKRLRELKLEFDTVSRVLFGSDGRINTEALLRYSDLHREMRELYCRKPVPTMLKKIDESLLDSIGHNCCCKKESGVNRRSSSNVANDRSRKDGFTPK
jgi:hypothetical protein